MKSSVALLSILVLTTACEPVRPRALGTLEWDRLTLPSPAAERIIAIEVHEGDVVKAGQVLARLEPAATQSLLVAAAAQQRRSDAALAELRAGPRSEEITRARAALRTAEAQQMDAAAQLQREEELLRQKLIAKAQVDRTQATADSAAAQTRSAEAALLELTRGTRREEIAQGTAAAQAADAQTTTQRVLLDKLTLVAPRDGVIDSLPYRLGDQPPIGAPVVVMLAGQAPYARVYVPEAIRLGVKAGSKALIHIEGQNRVWQGAVRVIRSEPTFTPYYALTGQDVARLSYLAEVQLEREAQGLPAGLPLWVEFTP